MPYSLMHTWTRISDMMHSVRICDRFAQHTALTGETTFWTDNNGNYPWKLYSLLALAGQRCARVYSNTGSRAYDESPRRDFPLAMTSMVQSGRGQR